MKKCSRTEETDSQNGRKNEIEKSKERERAAPPKGFTVR